MADKKSLQEIKPHFWRYVVTSSLPFYAGLFFGALLLYLFKGKFSYEIFVGSLIALAIVSIFFALLRKDHYRITIDSQFISGPVSGAKRITINRQSIDRNKTLANRPMIHRIFGYGLIWSLEGGRIYLSYHMFTKEQRNRILREIAIEL